MDTEIYQIAQSIETTLSDKGWSVATAESCTGGGIAAALTAVPGSSTCVRGGIVAYTEKIKMQMLHVLPETLRSQGVVSEQTVIEMAYGVMKTMNTTFAIATSGIAGPSGGTESVPVGTIWIAAVSPSNVFTHCIRHYNKGRHKNVKNAVLMALGMLQKVVEREENQP